MPVAIQQRHTEPEPSMSLERELISQCLAGNKDAFRRLIEPHQDLVFRIALSVLNNREAAEEAAQDTFVRAYQGLASFSLQAPFQAWLYRIAVRTCLNARRKHRWRLFERLATPEWLGTTVASPTQTPENTVIQNETQTRIRAIINQLPKKLHEVVVLTYLNEFTGKEIAHLLNIAEGTVKSRLHRAREILQKQIQKQGLLE